MLVLSHRGYHVGAPENTIEAFDQARRMGVDGIETDLRLTSDGRIILFHDRAVPDGREIASLAHAEVSRAVGYPVPTLDEALEGFDGLLWNLEIKVPEAVEGTLAALRRFGGSQRRFLITSFWHSAVAAVAARVAADGDLAKLANAQFGLLTADRPLSLDSLLGGEGAEAARLRAIVWYYEVLDRLLLSEARRRGVANYVYGVKTPAEHQRCRDLELDGVITDRPEMMTSIDRESVGGADRVHGGRL